MHGCLIHVIATCTFVEKGRARLTGVEKVSDKLDAYRQTHTKSVYA